MSYGVWKKRGQGWSMIEIDSPGLDAKQAWRSYAERYGREKALAKKRQFIAEGFACSSDLYAEFVEDDFTFLTWASGQKKKGWHIHELKTGSEHCIWIAVVDDSMLPVALNALKREGKTHRVA